MTTPRIAFIGTGNMNGAILEGALNAGLPAEAVVVTTKSQASADAWAEQHGLTTISGEQHGDANIQAVQEADVVMLGVKPHMILDVAKQISGSLKKDAVVVSIAAAISIEKIEGCLNQGQPVIRTMPNTPLQYGSGAVGLVRGTHATDDHVVDVTNVFEGAGKVFEIPENQIDALTAVSGSGPAYAFFLAEAMAHGGEKLGLDRELAEELAAATIAGAGLMLVKDERSAADLRKAVSSPGGTTEAAINTMSQEGLTEAVIAGQKACSDRAAEMGS